MCLHSVRKYMILKYLENCRLQKGIYMNNTSETSLQFHKITTRKEAEDFVYASYLRAASHQDYAAKDARKRHPELTRSLLWQKSVTPCIVVTGSKGKGSVSNMISRILQTRFSVGLMTSPHITDFRERFRVNDTMISESDFCRLMTEIQPEILNIASDLPESVCISPMGLIHTDSGRSEAIFRISGWISVIRRQKSDSLIIVSLTRKRSRKSVI